MNRKQIIAISGVSGGGKSTAAKVLEDLGFFVVDNLPPALFEGVISLSDQAATEIKRLAFVIDVREGQFLARFESIWQSLKKNGHDLKLLYLDASDETIVRRHQESRRPHPLDKGQGIRTCIAEERAALAKIKELATDEASTDSLTVHELKEILRQKFAHAQQKLGLTLMSFGFKHGVPAELDLCFDARFLPNPYFVQELKDGTGLDQRIADYVFRSEVAEAFLGSIEGFINQFLPHYEREGKAYMTIAIGCTGGRHRSVAVVEELSKRLVARQVACRVAHRDLQKS